MTIVATDEQEQLDCQTRAESLHHQQTNVGYSSSSAVTPPLQQDAPHQVSFPPVNYISFVCGLLAGAAQAGVFNPWDRALYLSIKNKNRFLSFENFEKPYQGK